VSKFNLNIVGQKFQQLKADLPKVMAGDAQRFFAKSFRDSGFTDESLRKWKDRKDKTNTRAILVKTGALKRAVGNSIKSISFNKTVIGVYGTVAAYGEIHNYGGTISKGQRSGHVSFGENDKTGKVQFLKGNGKNKGLINQQSKSVTFKGHDIKMPQRKFMGHSKTLEKQQIKKIKNALKKVWGK
jgi:phage gpG-like protein